MPIRTGQILNEDWKLSRDIRGDDTPTNVCLVFLNDVLLARIIGRDIQLVGVSVSLDQVGDFFPIGN